MHNVRLYFLRLNCWYPHYLGASSNYPDTNPLDLLRTCLRGISCASQVCADRRGRHFEAGRRFGGFLSSSPDHRKLNRRTRQSIRQPCRGRARGRSRPSPGTEASGLWTQTPCCPGRTACTHRGSWSCSCYRHIHCTWTPYSCPLKGRSTNGTSQSCIVLVLARGGSACSSLDSCQPPPWWEPDC